MASGNNKFSSSVKISSGLKIQQPFKSPVRGPDTDKEGFKNPLRVSSSPVISNGNNSKQKDNFSPSQLSTKGSRENCESRIDKTLQSPLNTTPRKPAASHSNCRGRLSVHSKISSHQFTTPFRSPISKVVTENKVSSQEEDLNNLLKRESDLDEEISSLKNLGFKVEELQDHINNLHRYNEIKDAAQIVMGRLAELEGVTVKEIHEKYEVTDLV